MKLRSVFKRKGPENDKVNVTVPSFAPSKSGGHRVSATPRVISFDRDTRDSVPPERMRDVALFDGEDSLREGPSQEDSVKKCAPDASVDKLCTSKQIKSSDVAKIASIPSTLPLGSGSRRSRHGRFSLKRIFGRKKSFKQEDTIASSLPIQIIPESYFEEDEIYGESNLSMDLKQLLADDESLLSAMRDLQPLGVVDHTERKGIPSQSMEDSATCDNGSFLRQEHSPVDATPDHGKSPENKPTESQFSQRWSSLEHMSSWFPAIKAAQMGDLLSIPEKEMETLELPEIDLTVLDDIFSWLEAQSSLTIEQIEQVNKWFDANSAGVTIATNANTQTHSSKTKVSKPKSQSSGGIIESFRNGTMELPKSMAKKKWKWHSTSSKQSGTAAFASAQLAPERGEELDGDQSPDIEECRDSACHGDDESELLGTAMSSRSMDEENRLGFSGSQDDTNGTASFESTDDRGDWSAYNSPGGQLLDPFSLDTRNQRDEEARVEAAIRVFRKHAEILGVDERDLLSAVQQSYHIGTSNRSDHDGSDCQESHLNSVRSDCVSVDSTIESMASFGLRSHSSIDSSGTKELNEYEQSQVMEGITMARATGSKVVASSACSAKSISSQASRFSVKTL
eukprot:Nitzschia sp. Nitz4//scaffold257_size48314//31298//33237//NITZ4_007093-RA/size48314-snap-gene-0.24-mRNA-1//1//CDS//3329544460//6984//frame0